MYKFIYDNKEYVLNNENLKYFLNDDENEVEGIDLEQVCNLLSGSEHVEFGEEFYTAKCEDCGFKIEELPKFFPFLEYHFYIFTKDNKFVTSSISSDYEENSYGRLARLGKVDNSFLLSIIVCENCGKFDIEIEQCEM